MNAPLAISMWDFSWLQRRWAPEAEYQDPAMVLDELVDRGYNCVRIDAFPHLLAQGTGGPAAGRFTVHPMREEFMWGRHQPTEIAPARALVEFVQLAAERDVAVGLSSWFNDDDTGRRHQVVSPTDYVHVWRSTLELLEQEDLLSAIAWVDLCNEFPMWSWAPGANESIFGPEGHARRAERWTDEQRSAVESYFAATDHLRATWPDLRYTYSFEPQSVSFRDLDYSDLDAIEPHLWLTGTAPELRRLSQFDGVLAGELQTHMDLMQEHYWPRRSEWLGMLRAEMEQWARLAHEQGVDLITTEGWSSVFWDTAPLASGRPCWDFVKDVAEFAIVNAIELGWTGICTSNFSQPHFAEFWDDVDWHRQSTQRIRSGSDIPAEPEARP